MGKIADRYITVDNWSIIEEGFHADRNEVSESLFSLGNEYSGVRAYIEEGVSAPSLRGAYFNGVYEWNIDTAAPGYKGIVHRTHYMASAHDWLYTKIYVDGESLDIAKQSISNFVRKLDMKTGVYTRSFVLNTPKGSVKFCFTRFLDMQCVEQAYQRIEISADYDAELSVTLGLSFKTKRGGEPTKWQVLKTSQTENYCDVLATTATTDQYIASRQYVVHNGAQSCADIDMGSGVKVSGKGSLTITKGIVNLVDKSGQIGLRLWDNLPQTIPSYEQVLEKNIKYWSDFWEKSDIEIKGDDENQQGIRFCIFQLQQTYHGAYPTDNIGAKGLTGEAYSGHAFWDTETYCLPYYLFNNLEAAKDLLMYRYNSLDAAKQRAIDLDCKGACYPIATLNGHEACSLWQHASLQMQPSTGVAYGIYHYVNISDDQDFLLNYGMELLVEISRYLVSRGDFDNFGNYGYYCVMGPDEFQMMVNHNCYTNFMAKKTLNYTLSVINRYKDTAQFKKLNVTNEELAMFKRCAEHMLILYDNKTKLFEQHDGFYKLPHVDIHSIPVEEFPLYAHWSYERIYRNDMIKQPDVLMFMLLYNCDFTLEQKIANYNFYEPKTIHESSLSPSVHSILACEIGEYKQALDFFGFASRLDLDNYNRNTCEGLHTTSIAAAWLNVVYGFGGVRSDGPDLIINPTIPNIWQGYSFKINYRGSNLRVEVTSSETVITVTGQPIVAVVYGKKQKLEGVCRFVR